MSANPQQKLWFDVVIDGVFNKGLGDRLTDSLRTELKALGMDLSRLAPAYPMDTVHRALQAAHRHLFPELSEAEALRELGRLSVRGYFDTFVGKAAVGMIRLIGVRRSLLRLHTTWRSGNNYVETTTSILGPTCIEISINDTSGMPTFWEGLLVEGANIAHAKNLRTTLLPAPNPPAQTYRVEWTD